MRLRTAVLGMTMGVGLSASAMPRVIRDWCLHRAWRVEQDDAHPERPARLVEIPWSAGSGAGFAGGQAKVGPAIQAAVRAGMPVTVTGRGAMAEIRLRGTALGTAQVGEVVSVRAGLDHAVVRGVVRGPGLVELVPEKGR